METFSASLVLRAGNSPVNSPHVGQCSGHLMFSLISAWINGWVNNRDAGDLRRHRGHYYVTVMFWFITGENTSDSWDIFENNSSEFSKILRYTTQAKLVWIWEVQWDDSHTIFFVFVCVCVCVWGGGGGGGGTKYLLVLSIHISLVLIEHWAWNQI